MSKPTVPEVLPMVQALYRRHAAGCCLHVLLDDGNIDDSTAHFCLDYAREEECEDCIKLAEKLILMSRTQRRKLRRMKRIVRRAT